MIIRAENNDIISKQKGFRHFFNDASLMSGFSQTYARYYILNSLAVPNYLSFDGLGLDLTTNGYKFYEDGEYTGLLTSGDMEDKTITSTIEFLEDGTEIAIDPQDIRIETFGECCSKVSVTYNSTDNATYDCVQDESDGNIYVLSKDNWLEGSKSITITFTLKGTTYLLKIASISIGGIKIYDDAFSASLSEEIDILSQDFPLDELNISISSETAIEKGSKMSVSNARIYFGTFFVDECERTGENTYNITCYNSSGKFEQNQYMQWTLYSKKTDDASIITFAEFIEELKAITGTEILTDEDLSEIQLYGHIPITTCRVALATAASSFGLMIDTSRGDVVRLKRIPTEISSFISGDRILGEAVVKETKETCVGVYENIQRGHTLSSTELKLTLTEGNNYTVLFDKPSKCYDTKNIISVIESGDNFLTFKALATVEGQPIEILEWQFVKISRNINPACAITASTNVKQQKFSNYSLIAIYADNDNDGSNNIEYDKDADIKKFISSEGTVTAKVILAGEKVGDLVEIETPWQGVKTGIITSLNNITFGYDNIADMEIMLWDL